NSFHFVPLDFATCRSVTSVAMQWHSEPVPEESKQLLCHLNDGTGPFVSRGIREARAVHGAALPPFACRAHPSPPRPVHPELDQVRVAADVARDHADRGTRGARGGGGPRGHAIDVLRRLPVRRQAALHAGDGSIVGAVGVLLRVARIERAGVGRRSAAEDDAVARAGKAPGPFPHVLAAGPGRSAHGRESSRGLIDELTQRRAEAWRYAAFGGAQRGRLVSRRVRRERNHDEQRDAHRYHSRTVHGGCPPAVTWVAAHSTRSKVRAGSLTAALGPSHCRRSCGASKRRPRPPGNCLPNSRHTCRAVGRTGSLRAPTRTPGNGPDRAV